MITLPLQPRSSVPFTAVLSDPDGGESGVKWQWFVEHKCQLPNKHGLRSRMPTLTRTRRSRSM